MKGTLTDLLQILLFNLSMTMSQLRCGAFQHHPYEFYILLSIIQPNAIQYRIVFMPGQNHTYYIPSGILWLFLSVARKPFQHL